MKGGSYIRETDGSLRRVEGTEPAKTRADKDEVRVTIHGDKPLSPEGEAAMAALVEAGRAAIRSRSSSAERGSANDKRRR